MLKYLIMLPVMIFPYYFTVLFAAMLLNADFADNMNDLLISGVLLFLLCLVIVTVSAVRTAAGKHKGHEASKLNLVTVLLYYPVFIPAVFMTAAFLLSFYAVLSGEENTDAVGMGMMAGMMLALLLPLAVMSLHPLLTGISSLGCCISLKRKGVFKGWKAFLYGIAGFFPLFNLIPAVKFLHAEKLQESVLSAPKDSGTAADH